VPKPSCEQDHLDEEYKGRNGTPGSVSEPDVFGADSLDQKVSTPNVGNPMLGVLEAIVQFCGATDGIGVEKIDT
jgi:hypothetical protein